MDGLKSLLMLVTVALGLIALYGVWVANFGVFGDIGSMEGSASIIAAVLALWGCCKMCVSAPKKRR